MSYSLAVLRAAIHPFYMIVLVLSDNKKSKHKKLTLLPHKRSPWVSTQPVKRFNYYSAASRASLAALAAAISALAAALSR